MAEDDQLQFLDSRVDYLEPVLKKIVAEYGADAIEIIPNVDIDTIFGKVCMILFTFGG